MAPSFEHLTQELKWTNVHENFTQPVRGIYRPENDGTGAVYAQHRESAAIVQEMIRDSMTSGDRVRGLGGRWSFTKCGATRGFQLDNRSLDLILPLTPPMIVGGATENLVLTQAGIKINHLNGWLEFLGKSLRTSGASDGQSIAGALSTGTHGAALHEGAIPDFVVGIQLATGAGKTLWLERESRPIAADDLLDAIDAEKRADDEIFNAALVAFGSFGMLLAVCIEVRDEFNLLERREGHHVDSALLHALETGDISRLDHESAGVRPHHVDAIVNPHAPGAGDQARVTIMHEVEWDDPGCKSDARRHGRIEDVIGDLRDELLQRLGPLVLGFDLDDALIWFTRNFDKLDIISSVWDEHLPAIVNRLMDSRYGVPYRGCGTHNEIFGPTDSFGKIASTAIAVDASDAPQVLQMALDIHAQQGPPVPGGFGNRLVKGTTATLGFTRFPLTCVFEIDGIDCNRMTTFNRSIWNALESADIDHAIHWGKMYEWTPERMVARCTQARLDAWLAARNEVLPDPAQRAVFTNGFLEQAGIDPQP